MNDREYWDALDAGAGTPRTGEVAESSAWYALRSRLASDEVGAERVRQVREFDYQIAHMLHEVQLPTTLAQRVRAALAEQSLISPLPVEPIPAGQPLVQPASDAAPKVSRSGAIFWRINRRQLAGIAAVAAACLGLLWLGLASRLSGDRPELTASQVLTSAMEWMEQVDEQTAWRQVTHLPTGRYKPSQAVAGTPLRFATLKTPWDGRTRLYEYPATGRSEQWCFVFRPSESTGQLAPVPPDRPAGGSGGWNLACWQEGPAVYVLLVLGSLDDYRRAVGPGRNFVSRPAQSIPLVAR